MPSGSTQHGNICHQCPDRIRVARNCPKPLRSKDVHDWRNPSANPRCEVLGYSQETGEPLKDITPDIIAKVWAIRTALPNLTRLPPDRIPADSAEWGLVVNDALAEAERVRADLKAMSQRNAEAARNAKQHD